jgi:hypothetical protein
MSLYDIRRGRTPPPSFPLHEHSLGSAPMLFLSQSSSLSALFRLLSTLRLLLRNSASKIVYPTKRPNPEVESRPAIRSAIDPPQHALSNRSQTPSPIARDSTLLMNTSPRINRNHDRNHNRQPRSKSKSKRKTT